jgi:hypothetical protein
VPPGKCPPYVIALMENAVPNQRRHQATIASDIGLPPI